MPAEFISLLFGLFCLFCRYRHGWNPPQRGNRFSSLPSVWESYYSKLACPSYSFPLFFISQRLRTIEPFLNLFRQTDTPPITPEPASKIFREERNR
jgi:hypothetical protein